MKRQPTYEQLIGQKLNGLTPPDVTGLWGNMEAILDREMPQQPKKKRIGAWWFSANMLIAAGLFASVGTVYTLYRVAGKEPPASILTEVATREIQQAEKSNAEQGALAETASPGKMATLLQHTSANDLRISSRSLSATVVVPEPLTVLAAAGQPGKEGNEAAEQNVAAGNDAVTKSDTPVVAEATVVSVAEEAGESMLTAPLEEALPVKTGLPSIFEQQPVAAPLAAKMIIAKQKEARVYSDKGFVAGLSLNLPVDLGQQQKLDLGRDGKKNAWQDYVPSVYAQLHLNRAFYLQAEWQPVVAQYTPNFTLYNRLDELNPDEKMQKVVKLNKLFYTSLPVSLHYNTPVKNLTVGVGMQYSKTKTIILQDQEYYHLIGAGGVFDVTELKNEVAVKDPEAVRSHNTGDVVDSVAHAFRRHEWRMLADVGYQFKGFHLGVRYTQGMNSYINTNFTALPVKDRNESLQLYLRFNVFDSRKK